MDGIRRERQRGRPDALGLGRLADRTRVSSRTARCSSAASPGSSARTVSASTPSTRRAARARRSRSGAEGCHNRGDDWIGLGNNQAPTQMSPEATSTAGRGYFDVPFYVNQGTWTMPASEQAAVRSGLHGVPLPADLRPSGARWHHQPDSGDGAVERDQPGDRPAVRAGRELSLSRGGELGPGERARPTTSVGSTSYVTGAHSIKIGYQYRQLDLLDKDLANDTQLGYRFNQGVPNAVSYYLPDFGRRTITKTQQRLRPGQLDARAG